MRFLVRLSYMWLEKTVLLTDHVTCRGVGCLLVNRHSNYSGMNLHTWSNWRISKASSHFIICVLIAICTYNFVIPNRPSAEKHLLIVAQSLEHLRLIRDILNLRMFNIRRFCLLRIGGIFREEPTTCYNKYNRGNIVPIADKYWQLKQKN